MPMLVRDPKGVPKAELAEIVSRLQVLMYGVDDDEGYLIWDEDKEVNGGDLVEMVGRILHEFDLAPIHQGPREWSPRKKNPGKMRPG